MIYRNWKSYQDALAAYNAARDAYESAIKEWTAKRNSFDKESDRVGLVGGFGGWAAIGAGCIAYHNGVASHYWGWLVAFFLIFGLYQAIGAKCHAYDKLHFLDTVPCPQFTVEEPIYDPLSEQAPPPPKSGPPPSPRTNLTLDAALSILGLTREATLPQIKQAYRDRIREYHPDKVAHLGPELRQLAEQKSKEINAAYECTLKTSQEHARP
jgi:hypothetical protein